MTDLEICKRIAEIEGLTIRIQSNYLMVRFEFSGTYAWLVYDPLNDKALCFDLMVKHKVAVDFFGDKSGGTIWDEQGEKMIAETVDNDIKKAICLAIIEAHKND